MRCLLCYRYISKYKWKKHNQAICQRRPYRFAKSELGNYFCYLGCEFGKKITRTELLHHLAYDHRNDISKLNSVGLSWRCLTKQCYLAEDKH